MAAEGGEEEAAEVEDLEEVDPTNALIEAALQMEAALVPIRSTSPKTSACLECETRWVFQLRVKNFGDSIAWNLTFISSLLPRNLTQPNPT